MKLEKDISIVKKPLNQNNIGIIYLIRNNINNKVYIGQTKRSLETRWAQHLQDSDKLDYALYKAMRKYGKDNFSIEIIEKCPFNILNDKEIYYIEKYNSYINNKNSNGYNMTKGGQNIIEYLRTPVYYINLDNFNFIYFNSISEAIQKTGISRTAIQKHLESKENLLLKHNYVFMNKELFESIENIEDYIKTKYNFYVQLTLEGEYIDCLHPHIQKNNKYNLMKIKECCEGKAITYKDFQWCYYKDLNKRIHKKVYKGGKRPHRPVNQYTLEGIFIKTYDNAKIASEITGIDSSCISKVCKKKRKTAGGYFWKYEE